MNGRKCNIKQSYWKQDSKKELYHNFHARYQEKSIVDFTIIQVLFLKIQSEYFKLDLWKKITLLKIALAIFKNPCIDFMLKFQVQGNWIHIFSLVYIKEYLGSQFEHFSLHFSLFMRYLIGKRKLMKWIYDLLFMRITKRILSHKLSYKFTKTVLCYVTHSYVTQIIPLVLSWF